MPALPTKPKPATVAKPTPTRPVVPVQQKSSRIDESGKPYSVKNPPKLPAPKLGEPLNLPPVPKMKPDPPKGPQTVQDTKLIASLQYMKMNKFMQQPKSIIKFDSVKEAEDTAKEDIVSAINERMHDIQQNMSELQKKGHDMSIQKMKLLQVPLKANLWKATRSAKELQKIFTIFLQIESIVNPKKKIQEKKDIYHEQYLKNREAQLENEKKSREITHKNLISPIKKNPKPVLPATPIQKKPRIQQKLQKPTPTAQPKQAQQPKK